MSGDALCAHCSKPIGRPTWSPTVWHHINRYGRHTQSLCTDVFAKPAEADDTAPRCVLCSRPAPYPYKGQCHACNSPYVEPATERPTR